jgi:sugar/nucleoside kinase (ribokinase family)
MKMVCVDSISVKVGDTTGAGDSFAAGFVYAYLAVQDLPRVAEVLAALQAY